MSYEPDLPEDLDAFWAETCETARMAPLDFRRSLSNDFDLPGFLVETIEFRGVEGRSLSGWLAYPQGARRMPGFVWVPPYGRESLLPNAYGVREGFVSLSFNFFGHGAFHQEKYEPRRGYFSQGAESPETWIFRTMFQNAFIACRVLEAQTEVDEDRIGAMGMSQGAGISIWLGAFCPIVRAVCADMPFLSAIQSLLRHGVYRYPLKELSDFAERIPLGLERVLHTVSYFDTVNIATRCRRPTQVSLGLKDPAVRPENARAVHAALPATKSLVEYPGGHDWDPAMVANNRTWLIEYLVTS